MGPGLRDNFFFLQPANRGEKRPGVIGAGGGRRGMGHDADGAGGGLGLVGVLASVSCRGDVLNWYFMSSGQKQMDKKHDDEHGAKGTNNRSSGGQIKQHRKIHT